MGVPAGVTKATRASYLCEGKGDSSVDREKKLKKMGAPPCAPGCLTSKVRAAMSGPFAQPLVEVEGS